MFDAYTHIIVRYGEIGTKGRNRPFFEKALVRNIKNLAGLAAKREFGRLIIELDEGFDKEKITEKLKKIFGIANFSFALKAELDIEDIKKKALLLANSSDKKTFAVKTRRVNKNFPLSSREVNRLVGDVIDKKADLTNPELPIHIEILGKCAYVYTEKIHGLGGLPVGVTGKVVSLISGGIDSPVASWLAMKRGCKVGFVHFHNYTMYGESVKKKITDLVEKLSMYQGKSRLYIVPFREIQQEIIRHVPAEYRMIVYRRVMLCIAEKIREKENARAFVTGDNIAQVASQTLENLDTIYAAAEKPVIAPLIGFDKKDIIDKAKQIGTYSISVQPYEDCCRYLIAEHPVTKSTKEEVEKMEERMELGEKINDAAEKAEVVII